MHGGRECVTDTSTGSPKLLSAEAPSQVRRDRDKLKQHTNLSTAKIVHEISNTREYIENVVVNRICEDDSTLQSLGVFRNSYLRDKRENAKCHTARKKGSTLQYYQIDQHDRNDQQPLQFRTSRIRYKNRRDESENITKERTVQTVKINNTRPLGVSIVTARLAHLSKEPGEVRTQTMQLC